MAEVKLTDDKIKWHRASWCLCPRSDPPHDDQGYDDDKNNSKKEEALMRHWIHNSSPPTIASEGGASIQDKNMPNTIIFVHGFGCNHHTWDPVVSLLLSCAEQRSQKHRIVTVDLVGHGESALPSTATREQRIEWLGDDLANLILYRFTNQQEQEQGKVYLVGHSMGCRVVLGAWSVLHSSLALEKKSTVEGIILVDGSYRAPTDDIVVNGNAMIQAINGQPETHRHFVQQTFNGMFFKNSPISKNEQEQIINEAQKLGGTLSASLFTSTVSFDAVEVPQILDQIRKADDDQEEALKMIILQSTTVMASEDGRTKMQPIAEADASNPWLDIVSERVPAANIVRVTNDDGEAPCGHFIQLECPELVVNAIQHVILQ